MKEILETIIKSLVENENEVIITEKENEKNLTFEVKTANSDKWTFFGGGL